MLLDLEDGRKKMAFRVPEPFLGFGVGGSPRCQKMNESRHELTIHGSGSLAKVLLAGEGDSIESLLGVWVS